MLETFWYLTQKRRRRSPLPFAESSNVLESRLLLSASATGKSREHTVKTQGATYNYDGFWSGYAQTESTTIDQTGKRVTVSFYAP